MRISKEFHFEAAHMLPNHDGKCKRLHGHTYRMIVSVDSEYQQLGVGSPKEGMLMDFGDLDRVVQSRILDQWDHRFLCNGDEWPVAQVMYPPNTDYCFVYTRTTVENLSKLAATILAREISFMGIEGGITVQLYEGLKNSASSYVVIPEKV